jgi:hypothetical protein
MSAKNLMQSLADRERVPKIQGLLNECMTFLDDELAVVTGPYEDLLSIDEVIEQELILFVTLNVNKNTIAEKETVSFHALSPAGISIPAKLAEVTPCWLATELINSLR